MKSSTRRLPTIFAVCVAIATGSARGQGPGYIGSLGGQIEVISPATGELLNSIEATSADGNVAVSPSGSTLYTTITSQPSTLGVLSAATGQMLSQIEGIGTCLVQPKVVLAPGGGHAFVMCQDGPEGRNSIALVNLATMSVGAYAHVQGGEPADIAISPNGKQFYLSTTKIGTSVGVVGAGAGLAKADAVQRPVYECPQVPGVCVFNTSTFALQAQVSVPTGHMAVSQDGNSLYLWNAIGVGQPFYVVNTTSLAVSTIDLPNSALSYTMAVSPVGNVALLSAFTQSGGQPYFVLNTQTNEISASFPAPLFPAGFYPMFGGNVIAFSLDGRSVWSLGCLAPGTCNIVSGQSFPSGNMIAETSLGASYDAVAISF